jgi:hypothetical protein
VELLVVLGCTEILACDVLEEIVVFGELVGDVCLSVSGGFQGF